MSRLYVGNISSKANMDEVHGLFLECGKLKSFNIQDGSGYIVNKISLVYLYIYNILSFRNMKRPKKQKKQLRSCILKKYVAKKLLLNHLAKFHHII